MIQKRSNKAPVVCSKWLGVFARGVQQKQVVSPPVTQVSVTSYLAAIPGARDLLQGFFDF